MTQVVLETPFEEVGREAATSGSDVESRPARLGGLLRPVRALRAVPHLATWAGLGVVTGGLVLLAVAWGRTAGLTNVGLQVPYVVSAGFTGVALVLVGLTVVSIDAKRRDAAARRAQLAELRALLAELRSAVEDDAR